jgi:hypothetical protein
MGVGAAKPGPEGVGEGLEIGVMAGVEGASLEADVEDPWRA